MEFASVSAYAKIMSQGASLKCRPCPLDSNSFSNLSESSAVFPLAILKSILISFASQHFFGGICLHGLIRGCLASQLAS